jgi:hypothetical protein
MLLDILSPVIGKILDFIPTPEKRAEAQLRLQQEINSNEQAIMKALLGADAAQIEVNKAEAANPSLFVSGWRPACGWICAFALGWQYILAPMANWVVVVGGLSAAVPKISADGLMELLSGLLGLAGMRTYEKYKGVNRQ